MEKRTRKYFRVKIHRIPPYYPINKNYFFEEDVWAYSEKGAAKKIKKEYKCFWGLYSVRKITEISKADFRGEKKAVRLKSEV